MDNYITFHYCHEVKGLRSTDDLWLLEGNLTCTFCSQCFQQTGPNSKLEIQYMEVFWLHIFKGIMVIFAYKQNTVPAILVIGHVFELMTSPWGQPEAIGLA